jgi:hypothetical protein
VKRAFKSAAAGRNWMRLFVINKGRPHKYHPVDLSLGSRDPSESPAPVLTSVSSLGSLPPVSTADKTTGKTTGGSEQTEEEKAQEEREAQATRQKESESRSTPSSLQLLSNNSVGNGHDSLSGISYDTSDPDMVLLMQDLGDNGYRTYYGIDGKPELVAVQRERSICWRWLKAAFPPPMDYTNMVDDGDVHEFWVQIMIKLLGKEDLVENRMKEAIWHNLYINVVSVSLLL